MEWYIYLAHFLLVFLGKQRASFCSGNIRVQLSVTLCLTSRYRFIIFSCECCLGFCEFCHWYSLLAGIGHFTFCLSLDA